MSDADLSDALEECGCGRLLNSSVVRRCPNCGTKLSREGDR